MKVLVVGGGGREHALAWKLSTDPSVDSVIVAPGNAGTDLEAGVSNRAVGADDIDGLIALAQSERIDLTVVGPEAPLVAGIVDRFSAEGLRCFGPVAAAAQLEGSKAFAKRFLAKHGIPTAGYGEFTAVESACEYIRAHGAPIVVKADGLAAGKGVVVAHTVADAEKAAAAMLEQSAFGTAGQKIVVEEFLSGEEASITAIVGGGTILTLASSQDHKARDNGDAGPNTGGMGAYSPAPVVDADMSARVRREILEPTVAGLAADGIDYTGFLYAGIMITPDGVPKVLEFNCRFGDPETQPILFRLRSELSVALNAALDGTLDTHSAEWDSRVALAVVMAAGGYPESYRKGDAIEGLGESAEHVKVFHAGTALDDGRIVTNGGRVLSAVALADTVTDAQREAYARVATINWADAYYRTDIGYRAVARETQL